MSVNASDSRYFSFHMETRGWKWPPLRARRRKSSQHKRMAGEPAVSGAASVD